jgi:hypothetical protein
VLTFPSRHRDVRRLQLFYTAETNRADVVICRLDI